MSEDVLYTILKVLSARASSQSLTNRGYTPSQIALLIKDVIDADYIIVLDDGSFGLTKKGTDLITSYQNKNNLKGINRHILPQDNYKTPTHEKYDIIFPDKW